MNNVKVALGAIVIAVIVSVYIYMLVRSLL